MGKRQNSELAGLNLPDIALDAVLSFLKDTRGTVNWGAKDLRECLKLDAKQAVQLLAILEMQGYVAKEGDQWLTTSAGENVSKSKQPQFSLAKVTEALNTLKDRIEAVNRDKGSEFKVTKAIAFGDFLSGRAQVQAADVGVEISRRDLRSGNTDELEEKRRAFLNELRRKSRSLSVQTYRPWMIHRSYRDLLY